MQRLLRLFIVMLPVTLVVLVLITWPWLGRPMWSHWQLQRANQALLYKIEGFQKVYYPIAAQECTVRIKSELPTYVQNQFDCLANTLIPMVTPKTAQVTIMTLASYHTQYNQAEDITEHLQSVLKLINAFRRHEEKIPYIMDWSDLKKCQQETNQEMAQFIALVQQPNR